MHRLEAALHAEQLAQTQAGELERLVSQVQGQLTETTQQRDVALAQVSQAQEGGYILQKQTQEQQTAFNHERDQLTQHIRAVEDRAHQEVDRCRQEIKDLKARSAALKKEYASREKVLVTEAQHATRELTSAVNQTASQRARADALETQLNKLKDLPAALRAVLRQDAVKDKPSRKPARAKKRL